MKAEMVRLDRVTQTDGEATLLGGMNLHIFRGEIMGLICVNSYGLEALIRLLGQNIPIHYGYIYFEERLVNSYRHSSLSHNRVSVIEKQSKLVQNLSVADNIFVLRRGFRQYLIRSKMLNEQYDLLAKELHIPINGNAQVGELSAYEKCVVELLRAVVAGAKLVILRDIGSFIGMANLRKFYGFIRHYAGLGISFLYICGHHKEAFPICDRIALMANGNIVKLLDKENFHESLLERFMAPQNEGKARPRAALQAGEEVLAFRHVETENLYDFNLSVRKAECVVLADADNAALGDIAELISGKTAPWRGKIFVDGRRVSCKAVKKNVCVISENPLQNMLFPEMSFLDNLCFMLDARTPLLWMSKRVRSGVLQEYEPLVGNDIYAGDITSLPAFSLYNLIYYRVHLYHPSAVFLVQPFAGADMHLCSQLAGLIGELKARGIAVVILAVNLTNSIAAADRELSIVRGHLA